MVTLLRSKPKLSYCGLTIVMSNRSRFDADFKRLLSATGGQLLNNHCLRPDFNTMQCDVREVTDDSPFLDNTKCLLLLGEQSMHKYAPNTTKNSLNEMRGSPLVSFNGYPCIAGYLAQEAADFKNYESTLNPLSANYTPDGNEYENDDDEGDVKSLGRTKLSNYPFWLRADCSKVKRILIGERPASPRANYVIFPELKQVIHQLTTNKNKLMFFDIETDYEEQNLLCFAFQFGAGNDIYSVPVLDHSYSLAYGSMHLLYKALSIAFRDNTVVAHNGAAFDYYVMSSKYKINVVKCWDTMLSQHRIYPDIEKSLGHCISLWTWEKFHKDTDSQKYYTRDDMMRKLEYCAKDVYTLGLVYEAQQAYAKTIPGLEASIQCAQDSIKSYLTCTLIGMKYNVQKVEALKTENDKLMMQYLRIINLLIGEEGLNECRKVIKGKAKGFANSNSQCCHYFHELLGYKVVGRSKKTQKASLGKKAIFKLALQHPDNLVLKFVIMYREVAKEFSTLKFNPFKDDNNRITKPIHPNEELQSLPGFGTPLSQSFMSIASR